MDATGARSSNPAERIRFGPFELNVRAGELRKGTARIRLPDQPLQLLLILLERPGEVVLREDIRNRLWPGSTVVEFDHSINAAARRLRDALRESADQPRYIETIPRRGYRFIGCLEMVAGKSEGSEALAEGVRPASDALATSPNGDDIPSGTPQVPETSRNRVSRVAVATAVLIASLAVAFLIRPALPPPRLTGSTQLTRDGRAKATMVTDGARIYFTYAAYAQPLYEVSTAGGDPVPLPIRDRTVVDISPDRDQLLVAGRAAGGECCSLWLIPVLGGSPRSLGQFRASFLDRGDRGSSPDAAFSRDGKEIVYVQGSDLWRVRIDGTESTKILSVADGGIPNWPRWSPDGKRLRFSVETRNNHSSLWEITADGKNLRRLLPRWANPSFECCGTWTPDGNYFIFQSDRGGSTNLWAVRETPSLFRKAEHEPVQLTTGPGSTYGALPGNDGKRLFVIAAQVRGEVVRYDQASRQFIPYLSGISAFGVNFSGDGKWITWVAYPEGTLWRSKPDGTDRFQLTFPPLYVVQPRWSPDGTRIAFMGQEPGKPWSVYVVPAAGGGLERLTPGDYRAVEPTWSPDGNSLLCGGMPGQVPPGALDLEFVDLRTHKVSKMVGSQELWSPRWSRDGRHILALHRGQDGLFVFDAKTGKWTELAKISVAYPEWSRDGNYIYCWSTPTGQPRRMFRVRVRDGKLEELASLKDFHQAPGWGDWEGLTFDDSPLLLRDAGIQDIYALDWEAP